MGTLIPFRPKDIAARATDPPTAAFRLAVSQTANVADVVAILGAANEMFPDDPRLALDLLCADLVGCDYAHACAHWAAFVAEHARNERDGKS